MATTKELQAAINTKLDAWLPLLATAQAKTLATDGRYFQGLATYATTPKDGVVLKGTKLTAKPVDRAESWSDAGLDPRLGATVSVDEYLTPDGDCGYVVNLEADLNGVVYCKAVNFGPEKDRDRDWSERAY